MIYKCPFQNIEILVREIIGVKFIEKWKKKKILYGFGLSYLLD